VGAIGKNDSDQPASFAGSAHMPIEQSIEQQFSGDTQWVPTALHSELHLPSMQFPLQP
jgi:hypothetical protein